VLTLQSVEAGRGRKKDIDPQKKGGVSPTETVELTSKKLEAALKSVVVH